MAAPTKTKSIKNRLLIVDLLLVNISLIAAFYIRYPNLSFFEDVYYLNLLLFFNIDWIFCTYLVGAYKIYRINSIESILKTVFQAVVFHVLLVTAFWVFVKAYYYSRQILVVSYCFIFFSVLMWRIFNFYYQRYLRELGYNLRKVVIAGYGEASKEIVDFFTKNPQFGYKFQGYFDDNVYKDTSQIINRISGLKEYVLSNEIDEIYCLVPTIPMEEVVDIIRFAENNTIRVKLIPDIKSFFYASSKLDLYGNTPVLLIKEYPLDDELNRFIKRLFDIVFSLGLIVFVFSWFFPIVGILIKLNSKGPVFFLQKRSGKNYDPFNCFKFRTMKYEKNAEFKQASKNDDRITKFGAFLRKSSIDEMPQFFNVLIGQMSVVGPRPHPLKLDEEYRNIIDKYMSRHFVKPGVTGLSQVKGYRGETKDAHLMKARVNIDNFYIERWSFFLDIKIIIMTITNLIKHDENPF